MKLLEEEKDNLERIYQAFLHDPKVLRMKEIPMHRGSNCYEHSFKVAKLAIKIALKRKNINLENLLLGCILHDYYLYNWREDKTKKWHGHKHPYLAAQNAFEDFKISTEIQKLITSHMWPINFFNFPNSKEAKILSTADKRVAMKEALTSKKYKEEHRKETLVFISHLFEPKKQN